ncbi:MAG: hypothetical protein ACXAC8_03455 [Candidatus Hodarchaeales archaeon]|jgi:hypothetical protein
MTDWDLIIFETQKKESILNRLRITKKDMTAAGQHGKATVLIDEKGKEWLLKTFSNIIDFEMKKILDLDVDIEESPEQSRDRMHLWRAFSELTASRLGRRLRLNVPEAIIVCSQQIANHELKPTTELDLGDVIILDEEEDTETAEEFYQFSDRDPYSIEASKNFEELLAKKSGRGDSSVVLALLIEMVPDSINLDEYLDSMKDVDEAFQIVQQIDDGYTLLPFDVWLNDPDRNAGNYLVQFDNEKQAQQIWGIDYEMWSLAGSDIWMDEDEITKGRSYLTAIIHSTCDVLDPRVNQTVHRIRSLTDEELTNMTRTPQLLCKYLEYHISQKNLEPDERIVLKQVETNLEDFLSESRPRSDKLSQLILKQIGLPSDYES